VCVGFSVPRPWMGKCRLNPPIPLPLCFMLALPAAPGGALGPQAPGLPAAPQPNPTSAGPTSCQTGGSGAACGTTPPSGPQPVFPASMRGGGIRRARFGCDRIGTKKTCQKFPPFFKDFYRIFTPFFLSLDPCPRKFPTHLAEKLTKFPPVSDFFLPIYFHVQIFHDAIVSYIFSPSPPVEQRGVLNDPPS